MAHELTLTALDESTKVATSVDSYVFKCPECGKQGRYAYSGTDRHEVFCDGDNLCTKVVFDSFLVEPVAAKYLYEIFCTDLTVDTSVRALEDYHIAALTGDGLMELIPDTTVYQLTEKGSDILADLKADIAARKAREGH